MVANFINSSYLFISIQLHIFTYSILGFFCDLSTFVIDLIWNLMTDFSWFTVVLLRSGTSRQSSWCTGWHTWTLTELQSVYSLRTSFLFCLGLSQYFSFWTFCHTLLGIFWYTWRGSSQPSKHFITMDTIADRIVYKLAFSNLLCRTLSESLTFFNPLMVEPTLVVTDFCTLLDSFLGLS